VETRDGQLRILQEGRSKKFPERVGQVTFNAARALERGQDVLYVTERAVFRPTADGLELVEIAPGVDLDRDILSQMGFPPILRNPRPMATSCFL